MEREGERVLQEDTLFNDMQLKAGGLYWQLGRAIYFNLQTNILATNICFNIIGRI